MNSVAVPDFWRRPSRPSRSPHLVQQGDGADVAAVIGFAAMHRAPIAEEIPGLGIGAGADVLDAADPGPGEARGDIAGQIEQRVTRARGRPKEALAGGILRRKTPDQVGSDLVARLADHRPERGRDTRALG